MVKNNYHSESDEHVHQFISEYLIIREKSKISDVDFISNSDCSEITYKRVKYSYIKRLFIPTYKTMIAITQGMIVTLGKQSLYLFASPMAHVIMMFLAGFAEAEVREVDAEKNTFLIEVRAKKD